MWYEEKKLTIFRNLKAPFKFFFKLICTMFFLFASFCSCSRYAILFAGSKNFFNYRHQADIFSVYNQLLLRGYSAKDIQLFAYDDIATDPENPYHGQIFHTLEHKENVYPGSSAIDVKGDKIDPKSFYDAITSLPTTSEDYVFIFYNDHGGDGTLGTPTGENIYGYSLSEVFDQVSSQKVYKKCLFLIEACFAGSIGKVIKAENVATITAGNDRELTHAAVWDTELGVWLTNEFTNAFINVIDESPEISVGELYEKLATLTEQSHASFYGDDTIKNEKLSNFIGSPNKKILRNSQFVSKETVTQRKASEMTLLFLSQHHQKPSVRARAKIEILRRKAQTEKLEATLDLIVKYIDPKNYEKIMNGIKSEVSQNYFEILNLFVMKFGEINPDDYPRFTVLKNLLLIILRMKL